MAIQKARIEIEPGFKAGSSGKTITEFECLFNPNELSVSKRARWDPVAVRGKSVPAMTYASGESSSLSMQLMFDTTATGDSITKYTDTLLLLTEPSQNLPSRDAKNKRPPWVRFHWGSWHSFKAFVESVSLSFTYFAGDGTPLRAKADVTFMQIEEDLTWLPQNPTSYTPEPHDLHQVTLGETLDRIAATYYRDATAWRAIAQANRITDPLGLEPGTLLVIPRRSDDA